MARMTSPPKVVVPMDGLRTGHFRHPMEPSIAVISISNIPAQGTCARNELIRLERYPPEMMQGLSTAISGGQS